MPPDHTLTRIPFIKHGALGDIVQALDSFASLRAGNPDAHITAKAALDVLEKLGLEPAA